MARPVIGICAAVERARWGVWEQDAFLIARSYVRAVQEAGGLAVVLVPDEGLLEAPDEVLDLLDGLLLAGGADIDPSAYGADAHPETKGTVPERDTFEIALTRRALERDLPLLGICRGMQVLNVAHGGTLRQEVAPDGSNPHRRALGTFEGSEHKVTVEPGSLAAAAIGEEVHTVRCHHHQGVAKLGEGLAVSARAAVDGLVEAIEADNGSWVLGVQWHPEADERTRLFEALTEAAGGPVRRGGKPGAGRGAPLPARERA